MPLISNSGTNYLTSLISKEKCRPFWSDVRKLLWYLVTISFYDLFCRFRALILTFFLFHDNGRSQFVTLEKRDSSVFNISINSYLHFWLFDWYKKKTSSNSFYVCFVDISIRSSVGLNEKETQKNFSYTDKHTKCIIILYASQI